MKPYIEIITKGNKTARLYKGFTQNESPKTWKEIGMISHNIGNNYNPDYLTVYLAKDKTYRYKIYRDGNFYPYFGKLEYIN
jgi:hypothetical protein